jgi:hypothetical protein
MKVKAATMFTQQSRSTFLLGRFAVELAAIQRHNLKHVTPYRVACFFRGAMTCDGISARK